MGKLTEQSFLPYTQEQLFNLVADVERYAEFIPWWITAKVSRRGDILYVEQAFNLGPFMQYRFRSQAALQPLSSVHITSCDGPFANLDIRWQVEPLTLGGCGITFSMDFSLRSALVQRLFEALCPCQAPQLLKAFEIRAHQLYGVK